MAAVSDARSASGSSASWFKVSESGLVSNNPDYWAVQVLNVSHYLCMAFLVLLMHFSFEKDNCGHYTFKVPSDIAPGNYLIRAEVIGTILITVLPS